MSSTNRHQTAQVVDFVYQIAHSWLMSSTNEAADLGDVSREPSALAVYRVRHELKLRRVTVTKNESLTPGVRSITFAGESLRDFASASFDDHVKLMLPPTGGGPLVLPTPGANGPVLPAGVSPPVRRDYTPRSFRPAAGELVIEFAIDGDGPAALWARSAKAGDEAGIGGPRGSTVVPLGYAWHLLAGDESALPAIARRLSEMPSGAQAIVLVETADPADRRKLATLARADVQWVAADRADALASALRALRLPDGIGYAWAAGEASSMRLFRDVLREAHGIQADRSRVGAYWKRGDSDHHETMD